MGEKMKPLLEGKRKINRENGTVSLMFQRIGSNSGGKQERSWDTGRMVVSQNNFKIFCLILMHLLFHQYIDNCCSNTQNYATQTYVTAELSGSTHLLEHTLQGGIDCGQSFLNILHTVIYLVN